MSSAIAHVLAKIDMNEDREILQNQYKDISHELNLKTDMLRRYKHKVQCTRSFTLSVCGRSFMFVGEITGERDNRYTE